MKRIFKQKPSPAMIVAMAALVVSIGGTAVAGPIAEISLNKGEKKQVRKITRNISNRVANRRISQRAPGLAVATANIANVANAANVATNAKNAENAENAENADNADDADQLDGKSINDVVMWAFVSSAGTLFRSSGGVSSSQTATGEYNVAFPRDVDSCAYTASNSANDGVGFAAPLQIGVALGNADNVVHVSTANSEGVSTSDQFMLQVTC